MSDINFIDTNAQTIYDTVITELEGGVSEELAQGDERRIFGEALVFLVAAIFEKVNDSCKQRLLRYARGEVLDAIAEICFLTRKEAVSASTTVRFSISETLIQDVSIPAGTRVTSDYESYFATDDVATITAGDTYADIPCTATVGGTAGNDIAVGQINALVDQVAYIDTVANTTITSGGEDEEDDDDFRERIRTSPATLSAGTEESYKYWAKAADSSIADAAVTNPSPGHVKITPICKDGGIPTQTILDKVYDSCNESSHRGFTDQLTVAAPDTVSYDIELKYYGPSDTIEEIIATVEGTGGAIEQYRLWQDTTLGRNINPDKLRTFILAPETGVGASRIEVTYPAYAEVDEDEVAHFSGNLTVSHEVEDD